MNEDFLRDFFKMPRKAPAEISLRDRFAIAALQGICAAGWQHEGNDHAELAKHAYLQADAMLAERAK